MATVSSLNTMKHVYVGKEVPLKYLFDTRFCNLYFQKIFSGIKQANSISGENNYVKATKLGCLPEAYTLPTLVKIVVQSYVFVCRVTETARSWKSSVYWCCLSSYLQ